MVIATALISPQSAEDKVLLWLHAVWLLGGFSAHDWSLTAAENA